MHSRKDNFFTDLRQSLQNSQSTRRQDYTMMNPELNTVLDPKCDNSDYTMMNPELNTVLDPKCDNSDYTMMNPELNTVLDPKCDNSDYTMMNPELNTVLDPKCDNFIPEMNRISVNRLRLGSHHLRIETGRWARIPRDERLCVCGGDIQSESHVLIDCPRSGHLRHNMNIHPTMSIRTV